jgi:polysaccharide biosynthesis transport protein
MRPMRPPQQDVLRYWDIFRRRWRLGALILLVVVGGVTFGALLQPPVYRATGLLEIRRESTGTVPVDTLFSSERVSADDLETQFGILRSATLAQRVAVHLATADADGGNGSPASLGQDARPGETAVEGAPLSESRVRSGLKINPIRGSRLVEVSFDSPHPGLSAGVVNAVLDTYLQLRMEEGQRSAAWLEHQLEEAQQRLETSERALQAYVQQQGLQVLETGRGETAQLMNERLQSLHQALAAAQAERIARQSAEEQVRQRASSRDLVSPVAQDLRVRLAELRREQAKLGSVFHDEYPALKAVRSQIAELERALDDEIKQVVSRGERDYQAALRREALLRRALEQQNAAVQALARSSAGTPGYEALKRDLVNNQEQFAILSQKLKEVSVSAALKATNVGIVDRATPPEVPTGAPLGFSVMLALMVGLIMGAGGIFAREHFDTTVRSVSDVDAYLGVPTLGAIPAVGPVPGLPAHVRRQWRRIDRDGRHQVALSEAFAALRTAVLLRGDSGPSPGSLLVTSAYSEEGKTTVSINLALSLARLDTRVLLVDANLRYPCVQEALGLADGPGLVDYLSTGRRWRDYVRTETESGLDVLVGGTPCESPADLLALPRMRALVAEASTEYDFVILDSPALLASPADVQLLATVTDGVLLTVRQGRTPREAVAQALSQLGNVSGVVLNRFDPGGFTLVRPDKQSAAV